MQRRTRIGRLAVLAVFVVICSSVGTAADLTVEGLTAENVNETFTEDTVRFETSYMNQTLDPQQVFVPDTLVDNLDAFTYSLQEFDEDQWPGVSAQLFLQVQYATHFSTDYPAENLSVVLGNDETVNTDLTPHQFIFNDVMRANQTGGLENVFDTRISDGPTAFNISVDAHYEHLLIHYHVVQNGTVVWKTTDVYSGVEPDRVAFEADAAQVNDTTTRQTITVDNRYDAQDFKVVGLVYDSAAEIQAIEWNGLEHTPVSVTYDGFVKPAVADAGLSDAVVLDDVLGMQTAYYNVTVPADTTPTIATTFRHPSTVEESGNDLQIQEQGPFYTYIIGSGGALKVTASQELCGDVTNSTGGFYDRVTIDATVTVCNRNSSSWTGQINITTNDWLNITENGKIDGDGAGHPWWNGTTKGGNGTGDNDESAEEAIACGGGGGGLGDLGGDGGTANDANTNCKNGTGGTAFNFLDLFDLPLGSSGGKGGGNLGLDGCGIGDAGSGGAAVFIRSRTVNIFGSITVDGEDASDSNVGCANDDVAFAGSGAGSGGTVVAHSRILNLTGAEVNATGGNGGDGDASCSSTWDCEAAGGGGGGGGEFRALWQHTLDDTGLSTDLSGGRAGSGARDEGGTIVDGENGSDGNLNKSNEELGLNFVPAFSQTLYRHDRKTGEQRIEYTLDHGGENDVRNQTGLASGDITTFTNNSLHANVSVPFNSFVTVTDQAEDSTTAETNITETDSGLRAHSFTHNLSEQRFNQTVTTTNNGPGSIDYNQTLDLCGTVVQGPTWQNSLSSGQSATHTGICKGDWVSEQPVNHTIVNDTIVDDGTVMITVNRTYTLQNSAPATAGITTNLSRHYDGGGVWTNHSNSVNTTTVAPGGRVEHIINISGVAVPEISTPFCPSGYADFGTYCKQETNIDGGTEYSYIQYLRPNTDLVENESVTHNISSSRFLDWTDRANIDAWVNDTQNNISFTPSDNGIEVTIEDDYGNSSVHKNILYETKIEYDNTGGSDGGGDDSDDGGSGGGGGGGGGGGTTTIIQNVTGAYSWTVAAPGSGSQRFQFFGYPGRTFSAPLELENTGSGPVNLSFQCLSSDGSCQWVDLSTDHVRLDASSFTETTVVVRGQVPMNASRDEYNFVVRVTDPSFNPANPEGGGKADVRFSVDMNRPLGVLIERYSRLAGIYTTIEAPDGAPLPEDAQGVPVPFVLIPLFAAGAVFAVARAVNDRTGPVLAVQILVALFVFIVVTGVVPPL